MDNTTILVIDDEPSNIQLIINILQKLDYKTKIISSSSSTLGLEIAIQTKPDIIITDWEMPEMNGIEVTLELKKNPATSEIPVIMSTGIKLSSVDLKHALDSGAFDFIRKPIDETELIARINSAVRFVGYYKEKIENEKIISKIREENYLLEIDSKKKELLSKTMMLLKINQSYEKYHENIKSISRETCRNDCPFFSHSQSFSSEMISNANRQVWEELELHFEQINESFYTKIYSRFPDLTKNERRLCAYLRLNLSTKDIASLTFQSQRSIEIARTRLREKLGIKGTEDDLHSYLLQF